MALMICKLTEQARKWGSGCQCHEEQVKAGHHVDCPEKGRRLKETRAYISFTRAQLREKANQLTIQDFGEESQLAQALESLGFLAGWIGMNVKWFEEIPYLLLWCDNPVDASECIRQYRSAPAETQP